MGRSKCADHSQSRHSRAPVAMALFREREGCISMVAAIITSADFFKVQTHWLPFDLTQGGEQVEPRPERLAPRTESRESSG
jgi:hypothetical protein